MESSDEVWKSRAGRRSHSCPLCIPGARTFRSRSQLVRHLRSQHPAEAGAIVRGLGIRSRPKRDHLGETRGERHSNPPARWCTDTSTPPQPLVDLSPRIERQESGHERGVHAEERVHVPQMVSSPSDCDCPRTDPFQGEGIESAVVPLEQSLLHWKVNFHISRQCYAELRNIMLQPGCLRDPDAFPTCRGLESIAERLRCMTLMTRTEWTSLGLSESSFIDSAVDPRDWIRFVFGRRLLRDSLYLPRCLADIDSSAAEDGEFFRAPIFRALYSRVPSLVDNAPSEVNIGDLREGDLIHLFVTLYYDSFTPHTYSTKSVGGLYLLLRNMRRCVASRRRNKFVVAVVRSSIDDPKMAPDLESDDSLSDADDGGLPACGSRDRRDGDPADELGSEAVPRKRRRRAPHSLFDSQFSSTGSRLLGRGGAGHACIRGHVASVDHETAMGGGQPATRTRSIHQCVEDLLKMVLVAFKEPFTVHDVLTGEDIRVKCHVLQMIGDMKERNSLCCVTGGSARYFCPKCELDCHASPVWTTGERRNAERSRSLAACPPPDASVLPRVVDRVRVLMNEYKGLKLDLVLSSPLFDPSLAAGFDPHRDLAGDLCHDVYLGVGKFLTIQMLKRLSRSQKAVLISRLSDSGIWPPGLRAVKNFTVVKSGIGKAEYIRTLMQVLPAVLVRIVNDESSIPLRDTWRCYAKCCLLASTLMSIRPIPDSGLRELSSRIARHVQTILSLFSKSRHVPRDKLHNWLHFAEDIGWHGSLADASSSALEMKHIDMKKYIVSGNKSQSYLSSAMTSEITMQTTRDLRRPLPDAASSSSVPVRPQRKVVFRDAQGRPQTHSASDTAMLDTVMRSRWWTDLCNGGVEGLGELWVWDEVVSPAMQKLKVDSYVSLLQTRQESRRPRYTTHGCSAAQVKAVLGADSGEGIWNYSLYLRELIACSSDEEHAVVGFPAGQRHLHLFRLAGYAVLPMDEEDIQIALSHYLPLFEQDKASVAKPDQDLRLSNPFFSPFSPTVFSNDWAPQE